MKRALSAVLVGSMLLFPLPAFATDSTNSIHSLTFDNLEQNMKDHSPLVLNAGDDVATSSSDINDGLDEFTQLKDSLLAHPPADYTAGMTLAAAATHAPAPKVVFTTDQELMDYVNAQANYFNLYNFVSQITTLQIQIDSFQKTKDNMWKSWLQVEQGKDQAIWGAQQAYLSYYTLSGQKDNLTSNLALLQKKLTTLQVKEALGMATHLEVVDVESQIKDLNATIDQLNKGLDATKGQLNVLLGQDYDTSLQLKEPSVITQSTISAIDYEEDLTAALTQSFDVRLKNDNTDKQDDAERNFTLAFHNSYQDILDKKKALDLEQYKLTNAKTKYDQAVLMNSLGLLANIDLEGARIPYTTQVNKVKTAQQDLVKAYTAYNWMKQGLTITTTPSSTPSSGSQSTSTAGM